MRVLHLIQELGVGGAERMTAALVDGARRAGHGVAIAAAPSALAGRLGVPMFPLPMIRRRLRRLPAARRAVRQALNAWRPDLVHCHNPAMALALALTTVPARPPRALVTIEGLRDEDYRPAARLLRWVRMPAVACGAGVAASLREHGVAAATIANGVPPPPPPADRAALEREWPQLRGRGLVVAAGRLVAVKNFGLAVAALAETPDAVLLIAGDGPERDALQRQARAAGVADRLVLAGFRADARAIIGTADVCVVPSHSEGLPLVALEALAAGRPLVATRARWQHEFLSDGEDCLLAPAGDASALAAAIRRLLASRELAARLSANAMRLAADYTEARAVDRYLRLYARLAAI